MTWRSPVIPDSARSTTLSANLVETGSLQPSPDQARVVNLYAGNTGPTGLDVYGWSDSGAALLASVGYGEASAWLDPGTISDSFGDSVSQITIQPSGEPPSDFGFNLVDLTRDIVGGTEKTIVVSPVRPTRLRGPAAAAPTFRSSSSAQAFSAMR